MDVDLTGKLKGGSMMERSLGRRQFAENIGVGSSCIQFKQFTAVYRKFHPIPFYRAACAGSKQS
jgi:hypothetical protein